jgi:hypothetical protein
VLLGIARLARGRADGLAQFGHTRQAFLGSLAPLLVFPLVGSGLMLAQGGGLAAAADMLAAFCALLAPAVLSHVLARLWDREGLWIRFATAFNWCQWAIPAVAAALLLVLGVLMQMGLPNQVGGMVAVLSLTGYGLWLHWFLARHGLRLSAWRAIALVVAVNLGTAALAVGPRLLALGSSTAQGTLWGPP